MEHLTKVSRYDSDKNVDTKTIIRKHKDSEKIFEKFIKLIIAYISINFWCVKVKEDKKGEG